MSLHSSLGDRVRLHLKTQTKPNQTMPRNNSNKREVTALQSGIRDGVNKRRRPDMVAHACNPSTWGGQTWRLTPIIPALGEAEVERLFALRSLRPA